MSRADTGERKIPRESLAYALDVDAINAPGIENWHITKTTGRMARSGSCKQIATLNHPTVGDAIHIYVSLTEEGVVDMYSVEWYRQDGEDELVDYNSDEGAMAFLEGAVRSAHERRKGRAEGKEQAIETLSEQFSSVVMNESDRSLLADD